MDNTIDPGALTRTLRMGGPHLLRRLIDTALANLETRRGELFRALEGDGDIQAAERAAHSIKSSARNLGATALGAAAEAAEELARQEATGWQAAARPLLEADLGGLRQALEKARQDLTQGNEGAA